MSEELDIEDVINKKSETLSDKANIWFDAIDFLELDAQKKEEVAVQVKTFSDADKLYWIQLLLSSIIVSLGLLQNSVAVVIGAMLIAPLMRPTNGISFAIARGEKRFFWVTLRIILLSISIAIFMGFLSVIFTGITFETSEILSRTSPNIVDLLIAIFSAIIAVLSLGFKRLGESIAGVAMAVALLPPLAVVGIELALTNYELAGGAMMLFIANLVAIIGVSAIVFWLYGFTPHTGDKQSSSLKSLTFIVIIMFIISIPLVSSLISINNKYVIQNKSRTYLESVLDRSSDRYIIDTLEVISVTDDKVILASTIKIPEGLNFYNTFKTQLDNGLSTELGNSVELQVELIRVVNIISTDEESTSNIGGFDILSGDQL